MEYKNVARVVAVLIITLCAFSARGTWVKPTTVHAAVQATYYAAPTGSGSTCTLVAPCALTTAQSLVRAQTTTMSGDLVVDLRGGTYEFTQTLAFSSTLNDSGQNGYNVIYQAYPGETPVLSGGRTISGWTQVNGTNIWQANVGTGVQTRELYVNGVRAVRARATGGLLGTVMQTTTGYTTTDTSLQRWGNPQDIEFVYELQYAQARCDVSSIFGTASSTTITMKQPCFANATTAPFSVTVPTYIENAYELLTKPGQWYLNRTTGVVYYMPRPGENITTASVVASVIGDLVSGTGTLNNPLHNIQFHGLTFAYATWLQASSNDGLLAEQEDHLYFTNQQKTEVFPTCNVSFTAAHAITISGNVFTHLGSCGLSFTYGSQTDTVVGNVFSDISANGIEIGDYTAPNPSDTRVRITGVQITDNYIHDVAVIYTPGVGLDVGYVASSVFMHNEIANLPYSGISVGYVGYTSFAHPGPSYAGNNVISNNLVHDILRTKADGGLIYTRGLNPGSTMDHNYVVGDYVEYGALYLDSSSSQWSVTNNVVGQTSNTDWLLLQDLSYGPALTNTVQNNYSFTSGFNTPFKGAYDPSNTVGPNQTGLTSFPVAAQTIINKAGLEPAYQYLRGSQTLNDTDPSIQYSGTNGSDWSYLPNRGRGDYSDDEHATCLLGAFVQVPFTGTGISLIGEKNSGGTTDEVYLDGVDEGSISTYRATVEPQQVLYRINGLSYGAHTLKVVKVTGGCSPLSYLEIDAAIVQIDGTTINDTDPSITYSGNGWFYSPMRGLGDYNNDIHATTTNGDAISYTFAGTGISYITEKYTDEGSADIYLDGVYQTTITATSTMRQTQQSIYSVTGLPLGTHTLRVVKTSGQYLVIDALTVQSGGSTFNDTDPSFTYSSGWFYSPNRGRNDYNDDEHATCTPGSSAQEIFTGSGASLLGEKNTAGGTDEVYVDGIDQGSISTYSATVEPQQVLYRIDGLPLGTHTLTVVKPLSSPGCSVSAYLEVDAVSVR